MFSMCRSGVLSLAVGIALVACASNGGGDGRLRRPFANPPGDPAGGETGAGDLDGDGGLPVFITPVADLTNCAVSYQRRNYPAIGPGGTSSAAFEPAQKFLLPSTVTLTNIVGFFSTHPGDGGRVVIEINPDSADTPGVGMLAGREITGPSIPNTSTGESGHYYRVEFPEAPTLTAGVSYWIHLRQPESIGIDGTFQWYYDEPLGGEDPVGRRSLLYDPDTRVHFEFGVNCP